jgi:hypothetical protein
MSALITARLLHYKQVSSHFSTVLMAESIHSLVVHQSQIVCDANVQYIMFTVRKSSRRCQLPPPIWFRLVKSDNIDYYMDGPMGRKHNKLYDICEQKAQFRKVVVFALT